MSGAEAGDPAPGRDRTIDLDELRTRIDEALSAALARARREVADRAAAAVDLVDEIARLVGAGGRRIRPILCLLGHAAGGGRADGALDAAAGLELLHTFALVHDDVMDEDDERRGVPSTHRLFAEPGGAGGSGGSGGGPGGAAFGRSAAVLVGDLAFALGVDQLLSAPMPAERVLAAARRLRGMALSTAAGQYLDIRGERGAVVRALKSGVYTAEVPLAIGAELAGAPPEVLEALEGFARPVGAAFQLLDDAADGAASSPDEARRQASRLLDEAEGALGRSAIDGAVVDALGRVVGLLRGTS
jgi:geranylgeranyl diphosphate synthase type I